MGTFGQRGVGWKAIHNGQFSDVYARLSHAAVALAVSFAWTGMDIECCRRIRGQ